MLYGYVQEKLKYRRQKKIADQVREGVVPKGVSKEEIWDALRATKRKNGIELFGFLSAKHFNPEGELIKDYGLVGVKKVTTAFAKFVTDAMCTSGDSAKFDDFFHHVPGDGSAAEASGDTGISEKMTRWPGSQSHGTTSNIFSSVVTEMTAGSAWTCIEHGIFNAATTSSGVLLDRTVLASPIPMATGDKITFNYQLTVNSET